MGCALLALAACASRTHNEAAFHANGELSSNAASSGAGKVVTYKRQLDLPVTARYFAPAQPSKREASAKTARVLVISPGGKVASQDMSSLAGAFVARGFSVFVVDFLAGVAAIPTQQENPSRLGAALRWDPARIEGLDDDERASIAGAQLFALGHSLGAAALGKTIGDAATPFDKVALLGASSFLTEPKSRKVEVVLFIGENDKRVDILKKAAFESLVSDSYRTIPKINHYCVIDGYDEGARREEKDGATDLDTAKCVEAVAEAIVPTLTPGALQSDARMERWQLDLCRNLAEELAETAAARGDLFLPVTRRYASPVSALPEFVLSKPELKTTARGRQMIVPILHAEKNTACKFKSLKAVGGASAVAGSEPTCKELFMGLWTKRSAEFGFVTSALNSVKETPLGTGVQWATSQPKVTRSGGRLDVEITSLSTDTDGAARYAGMKYCKIPSLD